MRTPIFLIVLLCAGSVVAPACDDSAPADVVDAAAVGVDTSEPGDGGVERDAATQGDSPSPMDGHDAAHDAAHDATLVPGDLRGEAEDAVASPDASSFRSSLALCWTDATCRRVMAIAHGGAWDPVNKPYDSNAAIAKAYALGIDGVKIDVRVTKDDVPVIAHSSPIELFESLDCYKKKIEEMTAAQVTQCHRFPSSTETFQRLDDVLAYLRGKMVTQLCVKRSADYGRVITELHALKAEDFAFIELASTSDLQNIIPKLPGADTIWYLVNVRDKVAEVNTILSTIKNPRAFMVEFDPTVPVTTITATQLHPANVRSFTYESSPLASTAQLKALFDGGFDVVSAQTAAAAVQARKLVNTARGISPP